MFFATLAELGMRFVEWCMKLWFSCWLLLFCLPWQNLAMEGGLLVEFIWNIRVLIEHLQLVEVANAGLPAGRSWFRSAWGLVLFCVELPITDPSNVLSLGDRSGYYKMASGMNGCLFHVLWCVQILLQKPKEHHPRVVNKAPAKFL